MKGIGAIIYLCISSVTLKLFRNNQFQREGVLGVFLLAWLEFYLSWRHPDTIGLPGGQIIPLLF